MQALLAEITWRPRIGDPDPLGWTITFAYLAAGWCCLMAGKSERTRLQSGLNTGHRQLWMILSAMMFALGINKQLDLQTLLTQVGREFAVYMNIHTSRRRFQAAFVLVGGIVAVGGLVVGLFAIRGRLKQYGLAFLGLLVLVGFVGIRAASLYHVSKSLNRSIGQTNLIYAALELGGTFLVGYGALKDSRRAK